MRVAARAGAEWRAASPTPDGPLSPAGDGRSAERRPGRPGAAATPTPTPTPGRGARGPGAAPARTGPLGAAGRRAFPHRLHLLVLTRCPPQLPPAAFSIFLTWWVPCSSCPSAPGNKPSSSQDWKEVPVGPPPQPHRGTPSRPRPFSPPLICSLSQPAPKAPQTLVLIPTLQLLQLSGSWGSAACLWFPEPGQASREDPQGY